MNRATSGTPRINTGLIIFSAAAMLAGVIPATARAQAGGELQQKLAAVKAISCCKPAETAPVSMDGKHTADAQRRPQASHPFHVPVWS